MARLIYSTLVSLDGYINDRDGSFDFAAPDHEVHQYVNDLMRPVGTHLYGRRLYEVMHAWETMDVADEPVAADFAQSWRRADKVVYSSTLTEVSSERTRIERTFDVDAVRRLKDHSDADLLVGGAGLAASAFQAGLVDEVHLFVFPVLVGGGTRALPDDVRLDLGLIAERRFTSGVVHLGHRVLDGTAA